MLRITVLAAMPWECRCVLPALRRVRKGRSSAFAWWQGQSACCEVTVVRTGIGVERVASVLPAVLETFNCDLLVNTGCAGGLAATLAPGHIVVADEILCSATARQFPVAPALVAACEQAARQGRLEVMVGRQLCVGEALASAAAKQYAALRWRAVAVDMESAGVARAATEKGLPFVSVRAILDPLQHPLPATDGVVDPQSGAPRPWRLLKHLLSNGPLGLRELRELHAWKQRAEQALASFFTRWLSADASLAAMTRHN